MKTIPLTRMATPEQEALEIEALRSQCPFPVSRDLLREMIRRSNPSLVGIALREVRERFNAALCAWSPSLCRRMTVRVWKKVCGDLQPLTVGAGSNLPPRVEREPVKLSKKEACALLYISLRTLERRMKAGRYQFTKTGEGQYSEVSFTYAGIGLREPVPEVIPLAVSHPPAPVPKVTEPEQVVPTGPLDNYVPGWNADHSMFITSEGVIYRRHPQTGEMYRSDERKLAGRLVPTSPSAADSVVRHPFSIQPSNQPRSRGGSGGSGQSFAEIWGKR